MTWYDRLAKNIIMISPNGTRFEAKWRGSDRSKSKKLGTYSPPNKVGTVVQDLDNDAVKYPMSIIFDGVNHDLTSNLFFVTCDEKGTWDVNHPIHGELKLQLVTVAQKDQPVTDGNYTMFDLQWIEPLEDDSFISSAKLSEDIQIQLQKLNESSSLQLEEIADQESAFTVQSLKNAFSSYNDLITDVLSSLTNLSADIARVVNGIQRAINSALQNPLLAINSISSQIQLLVQTPSLASDNIQDRLNAYTSLGNSFFGEQPSEISLAGRNTVAVKELVLTSIISTMPQIVTTGQIQTRNEALLFAEILSSYLDSITNELDTTQELFNDTTIDIRYFSQSGAYPDLVQLVALSIQFLLRASFDLKIEKRFKLKNDRAPIEVCISEYGELGENDEVFDFFIESNSLKGDEILLLPAGKEVVIYV